MNLIGIAGGAGSGKDTVAKLLVQEYDFVRMAFADPMKRIVMAVWPFTPEQLWGPSSRRAETPPGRDRPTAREALQLLGTEWGRKLDEDVWVRRTLMEAEHLLGRGGLYTPQVGYRPIGGLARPGGVVISDVRFDNEVDWIRKAGGRVWKLHRRVEDPEGGAENHASERGITGADADIYNGGSVDDLKATVRRHMEGV